MRSSFRKTWDDLDLKVESLYRKWKYRKIAKVRLKRMNGGFPCDKEYKEIIIPYWAKFGIKPKRYWYRIFSDREQKVDPRYIPDDLWYGVIVPYYSNTQFRRFGEDKCLHDVFFRELKRPYTLVKNIAGIFYDENMRILDFDTALEICNNSQEEFLLKPSIDSGEGRLIQFFSSDNKSSETIAEAMRGLKANYIAQTAVKQHPELSVLNPSSLNTIRVISFLFKNQVHILSSILRIGAAGAKIDNVGAGGFACPIKDNGWLQEEGVNRRAEWVAENNYGIKFKDVEVPSYDRIIETIKATHSRHAHFKLIGWDFSIDEDNDPVLIEYNVCPGSNQLSCGPTFGDLTEEVLQDVFVDKSLKYAQN